MAALSQPAIDCHAIRVVVFDAVGTLIHPHPPVAEAYAACGRRFGSQLDAAEIGPRFKHAFAAEEAKDAGGSATAGSRTDEARERRRWQAIVASVFDDVSAGEPLFEALWSHFAQAEHWALFADVEPALAALRTAGLRLAVASNFDHRLLKICRNKSALRDLDGLFVSSELGFRKPSPQFFAGVARGLDCPANALLMVGDDWTHDCVAPRTAGWQAVYLDRAAGPLPDRESRESITTLASLVPIVGK